MTRRAVAVVTVACLALVTTAVALVLSQTNGSSGLDTDGPMFTPPEHGIVIPGQRGSVFTDGFEVLRLEGDEPAKIVSIRSVGGESTFKFLGALMAGPDRRDGAISYLPAFPPRDSSLGPLVDAVGARIEPRVETRNGMGYELLIGYEVIDDTRVGYRAAVEVTYTVGDETYLWRSPGRMLFCPQGRTSEECNAEAEEADWGE